MPWSDYPILGQGQETFLAPPADKQIYIYIYIYIYFRQKLHDRQIPIYRKVPGSIK